MLELQLMLEEADRRAKRILFFVLKVVIVFHLVADKILPFI